MDLQQDALCSVVEMNKQINYCGKVVSVMTRAVEPWKGGQELTSILRNTELCTQGQGWVQGCFWAEEMVGCLPVFSPQDSDPRVTLCCVVFVGRTKYPSWDDSQWERPAE